MYGQRGIFTGGPVRKATGFMVPAGSALEEALSRRCDGSHQHEQLIGGNAGAAAAWPEELGRVIILAALEDRVRMSPELASLAAEEEPLAEWGVETIAEALMLRVELIQVSREVPRSGAPIRRLLLAFSPEGKLVRLDDFQEHEVAKGT